MKFKNFAKKIDIFDKFLSIKFLYGKLRGQCWTQIEVVELRNLPLLLKFIFAVYWVRLSGPMEDKIQRKNTQINIAHFDRREIYQARIDNSSIFRHTSSIRLKRDFENVPSYSLWQETGSFWKSEKTPWWTLVKASPARNI